MGDCFKGNQSTYWYNQWFWFGEKTNKIHIGYCIGAQWWHQGVMSEALAAVMKFFFEQVKVNSIESMHDPNNPNSGKVMKKCGMLYEGTLRQADYSNKGIVDACVCGLLAQDYFKNQTKNNTISVIFLFKLVILFQKINFKRYSIVNFLFVCKFVYQT